MYSCLIPLVLPICTQWSYRTWAIQEHPHLPMSCMNLLPGYSHDPGVKGCFKVVYIWQKK